MSQIFSMYGVRYTCFVANLSVGFALAFFPTATDASATTDQASLCDRAALEASARSGVPPDVLRAISLTETGRGAGSEVRPWPWTVNMQGRGEWFDTREAAEAFAARHRADGAISFDIGCFQLNYRWHGGAFNSIQDMFDPSRGASYAAAFLSRLYGEFGDWSLAAGAYHSRTPSLAQKYRVRFDAYRSALKENSPAQDVIEEPRKDSTARENRFPLLLTGREASRLGSLMPMSTGQPGLAPLFALERMN